MNVHKFQKHNEHLHFLLKARKFSQRYMNSSSVGQIMVTDELVFVSLAKIILLFVLFIVISDFAVFVSILKFLLTKTVFVGSRETSHHFSSCRNLSKSSSFESANFCFKRYLNILTLDASMCNSCAICRVFIFK